MKKTYKDGIDPCENGTAADETPVSERRGTARIRRVGEIPELLVCGTRAGPDAQRGQPADRQPRGAVRREAVRARRTRPHAHPRGRGVSRTRRRAAARDRQCVDRAAERPREPRPADDRERPDVYDQMAAAAAHALSRRRAGRHARLSPPSRAGRPVSVRARCGDPLWRRRMGRRTKRLSRRPDLRAGLHAGIRGAARAARPRRRRVGAAPGARTGGERMVRMGAAPPRDADECAGRRPLRTVFGADPGRPRPGSGSPWCRAS